MTGMRLYVTKSGARRLSPDPEDLRASTRISLGRHEMSTRAEVTVDHAVAERNRCAWVEDLNRCICRSRLRVGRCEFSARLFKYRLVRCRTPGRISRRATP